jgi:hypothetical protein
VFRGHSSPSEGLVVWRFTSGTNTDLDWQTYCQAIRKAARETSSHRHPCAFQVVESGSEDPSAKWRREIAEALKSVMPHSHFVLVTGSSVVRHVLTAIFWLRPPKFTVDLVATEEEGFDSLDAARPGSAARVRAILERLREPTP